MLNKNIYYFNMENLHCPKCDSTNTLEGGPTAKQVEDNQKPRQTQPPAPNNCYDCGHSWPYQEKN